MDKDKIDLFPSLFDMSDSLWNVWAEQNKKQDKSNNNKRSDVELLEEKSWSSNILVEPRYDPLCVFSPPAQEQNSTKRNLDLQTHLLICFKELELLSVLQDASHPDHARGKSRP